MKKSSLSLVAIVGLGVSAFAGHEVSSGGYKGHAQVVPCFSDREFQIDFFGSWIDSRDAGSGFGGGIGVNYFFHRYIGFGVDGNVSEVSRGLWTTSASLIGRYPLELGGVCLSPYALGGGGVQANGTTTGTWHAGGGLEWRATPMFGIFAEGRYIWTAGATSEENTRVSVGARIVF
jgi:hypothetical protein